MARATAHSRQSQGVSLLLSHFSRSNAFKSFLPYIGYVTIAMVSAFVRLLRNILTFLQNDFPQLKYALLCGLGLLALIQRE